jgi:RimJ/RimL family protein N-acetyltransferase
LSDLELMELHVKVLFKHDLENRITVVNETPFEAAPKIFIGGTKQGNVIRYSYNLNPRMLKDLERILETEQGTPLTQIINLITKEHQLTHVWMGPAYVFLNVVEKPSCKVIEVTLENKELLKPAFPYTFENFEYKQPCFAIVEDNVIVSLCCSARITSQAAEASLFTHEQYRGKAYAIDVAKAWAAAVQKQGKLALYSTSWDNFASQSVARKLQLVQYGTDIHID